MKVMLLITGLGMGGAEKVACELADKLYESGQEVCLVYFTGDIVRRPVHQNIKLYKIPLSSGISAFKSIYSLLKLVDQVQPDVIHAHMFHANIMARLVKLFRKSVRVICSSHSNFEGGRLRMATYALTENLCDVHTNVSDNASRALMQAGAVKNKKIMTVYNGIDSNRYKYDPDLRASTRQQLKIADDAKIIMTIGRIDTPKDYPTLLKAFKIVAEKEKNAFLLIVGDGPKKQEMENLANVLGIENRLQFLGIRNDITALLNASDVFVSSSAWEGFGLAILEAMLCERPIAATATDGAVELLQSNLVEIGKPEALAQMIENSLHSEQKNWIYPKAESFDWKYILAQWLNLYQGNAGK